MCILTSSRVRLTLLVTDPVLQSRGLESWSFPKRQILKVELRIHHMGRLGGSVG